MKMLVSFVNSFLSYVLLLLVVVAVAGIGLAIGITLRKKKDAEELAAGAEENV